MDVAQNKNSRGTMLYTCIPPAVISFDQWQPLLPDCLGSSLEIQHMCGCIVSLHCGCNMFSFNINGSILCTPSHPLFCSFDSICWIYTPPAF